MAKAQADIGLIPVEAYHEIKAHSTLAHVDMAQLKSTTELIGYPVLGVVRQLVQQCPMYGDDYCHFGATTQDVTDTATVMQIRDGLKWIETSLDHIMAAVSSLAIKYRDQPSK